MISKYIVVNDPNGYEPGVWGFNTLADAKEAYAYFKRSKEDVFIASIIVR